MLQPDNRSQKYMDLFSGIDNGTIKIPKFQRDFVWSKEQTAALIDSLIKGFPIGAFTYWETTDELRHVKEIGNFELPSTPTGHPVSYVLDGQQRITSLYAVRKGVLYGRKDGQTIDYKDISIDLSKDPESDEQVVYATSPDDVPTISVFDLLTKSVFKIVEQYKDDDQKKNIEIYKTRLEGYSFPVVVIGNQYPIDIATEVFTRINTGGTELHLFEIMVAKTYSEHRSFDLAEEYDLLLSGNGSEKCLRDVHYDTIDSATVLRCVAIHLGQDTRRKDILRLDKEEFIDCWDDVKKGIFAAVNFFRKTLRIPVSNLLPYNALLVPITYFYIREPRPSNDQKKSLQQYIWWASLSKRFSGAVDTGLSSDRRRMNAVLDGKSPSYRGELVTISKEDLIDQEFGAGEARCKAILCLYAYFRPRSFVTNEQVTIDNSWLQRSDSKNYHHFFPKKYLENDYEYWYANSILNITIVDDYLNKRRIRTKAPSVYMNEFKRENPDISRTMRSHLVPNLREYGVWDDDYDRFLERRAEKVAEELRMRLPQQ